MGTTCHRCGAYDPASSFRSERIPFRGARVYCPKCHSRLEENFLLGFLAADFGLGIFGLIFLFLNSSSEVGHVWVNIFLIQLVILPSTIIHEFAHAIIGRLAGLTVLRIWIGCGKTIYRAKFFGFDTEFKMVPVGGIAFLTHRVKAKLRPRYFLAIAAGPLANLCILLIAWKFANWRHFSLEKSIQTGTFVFLAQVLILIENLLPYRIQTALGRLTTDGLSLFQLLFSKSPDVLNSRLQIQNENAAAQPRPSTG
jgi:hypothetical protein